MLSVVLFTFLTLVPQDAGAVTLPDTPQGRHVKAYIEAFNTGDEKTYLAMMETHVDPALLAKRPADERAKLFQRMRGDFGTFKVSKVLTATAERIELAIPDKEGTVATFGFTFAAAAPHRIAGISVEIDRGPR